MEQKYQLEPGTVLDERYLIQRVMGKGGFGITYEGINRRVGIPVAIKEFFWQGYLTRDVTHSQEVVLNGSLTTEQFETEKKKFLREARIIGDFSEEPGVVHVIDYFEANNTAYIVMEYLEGENLKEIIKREGKGQPEKVFGSMLPLMRALEKIHQAGIIHRDISPDNILRLGDGSLRLLDFGAARSYLPDEDQSYSLVLKAGYAPCEQYVRRGNQGPWSDVYALCATIYYCITGTVPEDSVQRVLYDELKSPQELGIHMDSRLNEILMKGLEVKETDRFQSMGELLQELKEVLKEETPEPKKTSYKIVGAALGIAVAALAGTGGFWYYQANIEEFKFRGVETETVILEPDEEMSAREYYQAREVIEERLKILTGEDNYLLQEEEEGRLRIVTGVSAYAEEDIPMVLQGYLSRPCRPYLVNSQDYSQYQAIQPEDIASLKMIEELPEEIAMEAETEEGENPEQNRYVQLVLTEEKAEELKDLLQTAENQVYLANDVEKAQEENTRWVYFETISQGDGKTFYLVGEEGKESIMELAMYNMTHESFGPFFTFYYETAANWEQVENSMIAGENQTNEEEIPDPAAYLTYTYNDAFDTYTTGQWYNVIADFKCRLDTLGIPYAFGVEKSNDRNVVLKIAKDQVNLEQMSLLSLQNQNSVEITDRWKKLYTGSYSAFQLEETGDGTWQLVVKGEESSYIAEEIQKATEEMISQGSDRLYLSVDGYPVASCPLTEPVADNTFRFEEIDLAGATAITEENKKFFDFLSTLVMETDMPQIYELSHTTWTTEEGKIDTGIEESLPEEQRTLGVDEDRLRRIQKEVEAIDPQAEVKEKIQYGDRYLTVSFPWEDAETMAEEIIPRIEEIYEACDLGDGDYDSISFEWPGISEEQGEYMEIFIRKGYDTRSMNMHLYCYGGRLEEQAETLKAAIGESSLCQSLITEDSTVMIGKDT